MFKPLLLLAVTANIFFIISVKAHKGQKISSSSATASASSFPETVYDHDDHYSKYDDNSAMKRLLDANTALTGKYLYERLLKYPKRSYSVVTLPILCIMGHLAYHADGDEYEKILDIMDLNKYEIKKVLPAAVSHINYGTDTLSKFTFKVYRDHSQKFTQSFKYDFKDICRGESGQLNYDDPEQALEEVSEWFRQQSSIYPPIQMTSSNMFNKHDKNAIVYATYMNFLCNFDHEANPGALVDIDFQVGHNETLPFPSLYGNGNFKYAKLDDLDAEVIQIRLRGGKHFVVFYYPNNADDLPELLKKLQDPKVFNGGLDRAVWMCLKAHITIGHAFVSNDLFEFVPELSLNTTKFERVFESGDPAHVNYGFQQLHLVADTIVRKGPVDSKWCPKHGLPFVKMDHPSAYYVIDSKGMNVYSGIIYGPQNYST